jgi:hypothetical protein
MNSVVDISDSILKAKNNGEIIVHNNQKDIKVLGNKVKRNKKG